MTFISYNHIKVNRNAFGSCRKPLARWAIEVKQRDNSTCRHCQCKLKLEAHHILPQKEYPHWRYEVCNGVTLCYECHQLADAGKLDFKYLLELAYIAPCVSTE